MAELFATVELVEVPHNVRPRWQVRVNGRPAGDVVFDGTFWQPQTNSGDTPTVCEGGEGMPAALPTRDLAASVCVAEFFAVWSTREGPSLSNAL